MAIDGAPSALLDGAPSALLPESEAGVESEAGLESEAGDSLNLKPPAQTEAEPVKNHGVDAVHHDDVDNDGDDNDDYDDDDDDDDDRSIP